MPVILDDHILSLLNDATLLDEDNQVLMTACLNVTLFFDKAYTQEKRQAILTMFADYQNMMGDKLTFTTNPQTGSWKNLTKTHYPTPETWLLDLPNEPWEFIYHGGEHHRDASDIQFRILGSAEWQEQGGDLSWVSINFPLSFFADWHETLQDVILRWIKSLQPMHGFAAIATTHNYFKDYSYAPTEYQLAMKYPGLDVTNHITLGIAVKNQYIKGINWLTILNQAFLDKVGGVDALKAIKGLTVWQEDQVFLIQAANVPALQVIPDSYYQLGEVIKPLRYQEPEVPVYAPRGEGFSNEAFAKWLARFDQKPQQ